MITKPKGTYDLYSDKGKVFSYIEDTIKEIMHSYNYEYIKTPVFESSSLFHRGVGASSDIVRKETYDFVDRGDRNMTLRPEGTAGIVRSFIENKLYADTIMPRKLWYLGTMYRYERPQSGRYREFTQFGCETFGSDSAMLDAEIISIPVVLFEKLGLKGIKVKVNTLGDNESRKAYKEALVEYFKPHLNELCDDCKERFEKNPLRILDCKVDKDSEILKNAPKTFDYLNEESKKHFDQVLQHLNDLEINYEVDSNVIRGLDYYTHTVFEIEADVEGFGAQNVMCGGGRYNNLVEELGGPKTSAVGFAIGIERLMMALEYEDLEKDITYNSIDTYIAPLSEEANSFAFSLNSALRLVGVTSEIDYCSRSLKSNLKQAERLNAKYILIIGEDELKEEYITIKNLETKEEQKVKNHEILEFLYNSLVEEEECSCGHCHHE